MRFSFFIIFLSLMMFFGRSFAQNDMDSQGNQKEMISRVDNQWYIGSTPVKKILLKMH